MPGWLSDSRARSSSAQKGVHIRRCTAMIARHSNTLIEPSITAMCHVDQQAQQFTTQVGHEAEIVCAPCFKSPPAPTWQDDLSHPWCKGEPLQELCGSVSRNESWVPHQTLQELNIVGHSLQLTAWAGGHTQGQATHTARARIRLLLAVVSQQRYPIVPTMGRLKSLSCFQYSLAKAVRHGYGCHRVLDCSVKRILCICVLMSAHIRCHLTHEDPDV